MEMAKVQSHNLGCMGLLCYIRGRQTFFSQNRRGHRALPSATQDTPRGMSTQAPKCTVGTNTRQQCLSVYAGLTYAWRVHPDPHSAVPA